MKKWMDEGVIEQRWNTGTGGSTNKILTIIDDPKKEERSSKKHTSFQNTPVKYGTIEVDLKLCLESLKEGK